MSNIEDYSLVLVNEGALLDFKKLVDKMGIIR